MNEEQPQPTPAEQQAQEVSRQIALINKLGKTEEFRAWRELVIESNLKQLKERIKTGADQMSEVELRASLKHYFTLEAEYYTIFDQIEVQLELERVQQGE